MLRIYRESWHSSLCKMDMSLFVSRDFKAWNNASAFEWTDGLAASILMYALLFLFLGDVFRLDLFVSVAPIWLSVIISLVSSLTGQPDRLSWDSVLFLDRSFGFISSMIYVGGVYDPFISAWDCWTWLFGASVCASSEVFLDALELVRPCTPYPGSFC